MMHRDYMEEPTWNFPYEVLADLNDERQVVVHRSAVISAPSVVTRDRLECLLRGEHDLQLVEPRFFEELVAELLAADGWRDIDLVSRLNAHGPDIIARGLQGDETLIVECKRWNGAVGIDVVRTVMYWVEQQFEADQGLIATTSRFTRDAIDARDRRHRWRLDLADSERMKEWICRNLPQISDSYSPVISVLPADAFIQRVLSYRWPKQTGRVQLASIDTPCQRCGGYVVCGAANGGTTKNRFRADYFHVCRACRWSIETLRDARRSRRAAAIFSACPFCSRQVDDLL